METMQPYTEKALAHILLIELLASPTRYDGKRVSSVPRLLHFFYPSALPTGRNKFTKETSVDRIETQDYILGNLQAQRVVEIGPSNVLTTMMKRTWEMKFAAGDKSRNLHRTFIGPRDGYAEAYYQTYHTAMDDEDPMPSGSRAGDQGRPEQRPSSASTERLTGPTQPERSVSPVTHVAPDMSLTLLDDTPVPASIIVRTLVAIKLKKQPRDIILDQTISGLVGGRSTLSNEIVGDIQAEFPAHVPERPEDTALAELGQSLGTAHDGRLGRATASLVARMISSKFPGDYGQSRVRQVLNERLGLGPMRQDAVLLLALTKQPATRLTSPAASDAFLTEVAAEYLHEQGLALPRPPAATGRSPGAAAPLVDAEALHASNGKNISLIRNVAETLSHHLAGQGHDAPPGNSADAAVEAAAASTELLDMWLAEHGDDYATGIRPAFDARKERVYDSYWNWSSEDVTRLLVLCSDPCAEHSDLVDDLSASIVNRACDRTVSQLRYLASKAGAQGAEGKHQFKTLALLYEACLASKDRDPVFVDREPDSAPSPLVESDGSPSILQVPPNACSREEAQVGIPPSKPETAYATGSPPVGEFTVGEFRDGACSFSRRLTSLYANDRRIAKHCGFTFAGRNVLLTGAGKNSIGFHILRRLLSGGARVILTTSSYSPETTRMYQGLYAKYGAKGSILRVVPFNQGSRQDVESLVQWISDDGTRDLDFIIPFAALSESGRDIENLDSRSEVAHRAMLVNLLRMLGAVARAKRARGVLTRPATVVLPLSPNHGLMGSDGLYSESKRSLEALMSKWVSESWSDYLSLLGVVIGWTRGTGLMAENDVVAQGVEALGARTFRSSEMATSIATLMGGSINAECQLLPLMVDLSGGMGKIRDFAKAVTTIRRSLRSSADTQRAVAWERSRDAAVAAGPRASAAGGKTKALSARANIKLSLPRLPDYDKEIPPLAGSLEGMVDLSRTVVITGFAELGPHGNSRTRWEMEAAGELSLEGCVELAWMMGLIKHHSGTANGGSPLSGWVDAKTSVAVDEADIPARYMSTILAHTGLRRIEPEMCDNAYDPERKESLQEVVLQRDLSPFDATPEAAENLRRKHGDRAVVTRGGSSEMCRVQLKAGATIMVPRAGRFNRTVAGQIPTGWSAKRYGVADEIIEQVDPVTLFSLVCVVEALLCSGITDPYEWYRYIHVSELGNCLGSSMGGLSSLRQMHRGRFVDGLVKGDVLQETFVNTTGAWVNMLLTSAAGPIRTPVGACATSLESLDAACDLITARKAKVVLVGGVEDFVEDVSFEFGNMQATCDTDAEFARGRSPAEMSRPTASSRSGFVEAQGCGVQVVTSAELALEMGLPIYGIVAYTNMAADKAGRSVPAPGKGVLVNAREPGPAVAASPLRPVAAGHAPPPWPILDLDHRRRMLTRRREQIREYVQDSLARLEEEVAASRQLKTLLVGEEELDEYRQQLVEAIREDARRQDADAAFSLGNEFWKGDEKQRISPIRGSLATWGLSIDDISVASLHGTSTAKNDLNEPSVIQEQMRHLGRREGNLLPCVCQKWLTGHSKGAAGAWMVNGCLQMLDSGLVPGNRNADNVDELLRQHRHLLFPGTTVRLGGNGAGIKACSVTSFGFGQKGAQAILVHPRYLFATVPKERYQTYTEKRDKRWQRACQAHSTAMMHENMVSACVKEQPPYPPDSEVSVLLDPSVRFGAVAQGLTAS
ncbi:hypothetical protein QQZ08_009246 [Neonectria magnoliae]|uniref:beta-ketoacyl-[acyl-carrier-protein] synthase I n=1 Tax=Neonectria magnoliae TaxID=2732573 RepID=A0ABR1HQK1_9HYPO